MVHPLLFLSRCRDRSRPVQKPISRTNRADISRSARGTPAWRSSLLGVPHRTPERPEGHFASCGALQQAAWITLATFPPIWRTVLIASSRTAPFGTHLATSPSSNASRPEKGAPASREKGGSLSADQLREHIRSLRRTCREIPSFFILATRVVRFSPSRAAAPPDPPITQPVSRNACKIRARVESLNVLREGVIASGFLSDTRRGFVTAFLSDVGSGFGSTPFFDRMTARSIKF
jgi:hypothetical protein